MTTALVWFRKDLRLHDNPALVEACLHYDHVICIYINDTSLTYQLGNAQRWWLHHSLTHLQNSLQQEQTQLILRQGSAEKIISELVLTEHIDAVFWNRCYEPDAITRDTQLKSLLKEQSVQVYTFNASLLNEPWTIQTNNQTYFKVFTPYWKRCLSTMQLRSVLAKPKLKPYKKLPSDHLTDWQLLPTWPHQFAEYWQPSEDGAKQKLENFIEHALMNYHTSRDDPAQAGTSRLSPHLHFGEISPVQIWQAIAQALARNSRFIQASERYFAELGWREFSYYLLYHFPALPEENFRSQFNTFSWQTEPQLLSAWQKGWTGYPIVDAGMRELWITGTMHNRVRMITASFLTKHCLIDWRAGAAWFLDTLLDADLASNSASWQWVAGCGADAAPYFRIFNPILQSEKFDPQALYLKKWLPELKDLPTKFIHQPWLATSAILKQAQVELGSTYPEPILDLQACRQRALEAYKQIRIKGAR